MGLFDIFKKRSIGESLDRTAKQEEPSVADICASIGHDWVAATASADEHNANPIDAGMIEDRRWLSSLR
jgi:hypothetical protein